MQNAYRYQTRAGTATRVTTDNTNRDERQGNQVVLILESLHTIDAYSTVHKACIPQI